MRHPRWPTPECCSARRRPPRPRRRSPGLDPGCLCHGAEAGQHTTGEQRRTVERKLVGDGHDLGFVNDDPLGERCGAKPVQDRLAVRACSVAPSRRGGSSSRTAPAARGAEKACPAPPDERDERPLPRRHAGHAGTDSDDRACSLVAVDRRQRTIPRAVEVEDVAVADSARGDPHLDLPGPGGARTSSSIVSGWPGSRSTAALISLPVVTP